MITRRTLLGYNGGGRRCRSRRFAQSGDEPLAGRHGRIETHLPDTASVFRRRKPLPGGDLVRTARRTSMYVVTATDAWRAPKPFGAASNRARVWVGDVGNWRRADGRYRELLPAVEATASIETDATRREQVLSAMGEKYADEWPTWGPRFRNSRWPTGRRVMLKYQPDLA